MSVNLIGVSGRIGSGKDTVGKIIQDLTLNSYQQSPWQIKKFAGKLKQIVSILTGIPVEDLEKQSVKDQVLGPEWQRAFPFPDPTRGFVIGNYTVRELLQKIGTEAMRDQIHQNIWVNALFSDYKTISEKCNRCDGDGYRERDHGQHQVACDACYGTGENGYHHFQKWVITDVRFPNEAQAIKKRGGIVIRLKRNDKPTKGLHPSETALDDYNFDEVIINDGTIEDLTDKVRLFLLKYEI